MNQERRSPCGHERIAIRKRSARGAVPLADGVAGHIGSFCCKDAPAVCNVSREVKECRKYGCGKHEGRLLPATRFTCPNSL